MAEKQDSAAKARLLRTVSIFAPLTTLILVFSVLTYFADLDSVIAGVIATVFASMEWLFLAGAARKLENDSKTIG